MLVQHFSTTFTSERSIPLSSQFHRDSTTANMPYLTHLIIISTLLSGSSSSDSSQELVLTNNPGLHAFTVPTHDISFGSLIVTINTKQVVRAVQKAAATMDKMIKSPSPFLKLMGRRVMVN